VRGVRHGEAAVDGRFLAASMLVVFGRSRPRTPRGVDHQEAQLPELAQELDHQVEIVVLQLFHVGEDFFAEELVRGVGELKLLVAESSG